MTAEKFNKCIEKLRAGDTQGLAAIYNEYYEKMTIVAQGIVKDYHAARDIASDFIKYILEFPDKIKEIKYPNTWILKSIHNKAVDYIKKDSKNILLHEYYDIIDSYDPDFELNHLITEELNNLQKHEKELLILHYEYGLKYKEIADLINAPEGTIKSSISRLKKKLKEIKKYL